MPQLQSYQRGMVTQNASAKNKMKKKYSKTKAGFITLLTGCLIPVLIHFFMSILDLDPDQKVDDISQLELWAFLIAVSLLCGVAVAISIGIVNFSSAIYFFLVKRIKGEN